MFKKIRKFVFNLRLDYHTLCMDYAMIRQWRCLGKNDKKFKRLERIAERHHNIKRKMSEPMMKRAGLSW